ncbi:MAG TPA: hypothetical protein VNI01_09135, partial [Elusimicrobiota bacterium]|nr:hypothetical protein [Elusimicrobiota bacterium]
EATGSDSCAYWRPAGQDEEAGGVPWRHERPREDRVRVAGEAAAPGTLFLSELRYPGWEAYVNGGRVESAPASGAFTALPVPAGKSEVFWIYRPWSWPIGLLASLLTAIMLVSDARQVNKVNEVNA